MNERKSITKRSIALYFFMYCPLGFVCPLIGQYCTSIGFSGTQVGVVTSAATGAAVLGGLFWGRLYANAMRKRLIVMIMFALSACMSLISLTTGMFILYTALYSLLYFNQGPSHGLCDSMIIANGENFPVVRAIGAIGYAAACFTGGQWAETHGLRGIFVMHAVSYLIAIAVMTGEKEPPHYAIEEKVHANGGNENDIRKKTEKITALKLMKDKDFLQLLLCSFFTLGTTMANNTYFSYLYTEVGGDLAGIGTAFMLMAGSEAVFMLLVPVLNKKISTEKLIMIGISAAIIRFLIYSTGPSTAVLLGTFFLQGIMNGIILVEIVRYFEKIVEPEYSSISVSTYYALGNNLSAIVCNMVAGVILDAAGATGVYVFFAAFNAVGLALYILFGLYKPRRAYTL